MRRKVITRALLLAVSAVCLYLLAPSILQVFASIDDLAQVNPLWFPLILGLQAASFACIWVLQRLALRTDGWFPVATSQLAGNAFSRVVPGGAAAGVALQYRMLASAGVPTARAASSLTAVSLLITGVVLALPVLAIPAILGGTPVESGLVRAAWLGLLVFVVMVGLGAVLLFSVRTLEILASGVQWIVNKVRRRQAITDLPARLLGERALIKATLQSRWWEALLAAVGRSMFDYASLLVALLAVGANPNPSLVLLAYVASQVLAMIPITPGGLGFVEAGLTATLALAGVPAALAVVATLAYRLASYWIPLLAGLVAMGLFRYRQRLGVV
ncbi:MAG: flippase-like domain-containing protein [Acidimicrobiia bacterium]|nr:flippase-like domain-containing protein [Acidimicrobiia bacterium]